MITKTYENISKEELYKLYLRLLGVLNPYLSLTSTQVNLLTEFLLLEGSKFKHARFAKRARALVLENLNGKSDKSIGEPTVLHHLKNIENLGYIERDSEGIRYFNKRHQAVVDKLLNSEEYFNIIFKIKMK